MTAQIPGKESMPGPLRQVLTYVEQWMRRMEITLGVDPLGPPQVEDNTKLAPPPQATFTVEGSDGTFAIAITNPKSTDPGLGPMLHELRASKTVPFAASALIDIYGPSFQTDWNILDPAVSKFWELRSRYIHSDWNGPVLSDVVSSGPLPNQGPIGPQGPAGNQGPPGVQGPAGSSTTDYLVYDSASTPTKLYAAPNPSSSSSPRDITLDVDESSATGNTAFGHKNLANLIDGYQNTAVGYEALLAVTHGYANTAVGYLALTATIGATNGYGNTAMGAQALTANVEGFQNTAVGYKALSANTSGQQNVAVGEQAAGALGGGNTTGNQNTAVGHIALGLATTGSGNTALGYRSGYGVSTGSTTTCIGYQANVSSGALTNATALGANASVNASNKVRIGATTVTVVEGQVAYTFPSDRNQKENFQDIDVDAVLTKLLQIPVTSWNYIGHDPQEFRHYGPMAQDFFDAFGQDRYGRIGTETTLNTGDVAGILILAVQGLAKRLQRLEQSLIQ